MMSCEMYDILISNTGLIHLRNQGFMILVVLLDSQANQSPNIDQKEHELHNYRTKELIETHP